MMMHDGQMGMRHLGFELNLLHAHAGPLQIQFAFAWKGLRVEVEKIETEN
jgi:hypothetical protein